MAFGSPRREFDATSVMNTIKTCMALRRLLLSLAMGIIMLYVPGCARTARNGDEGKNVPAKSIQQVLREHTDEWMAIAGVVGVAEGKFENKPCITILAIKKTREIAKKFPTKVESFPVIIKETGEIRALK